MSQDWTEVTIGDVCTKPQYGWTTKARADGGAVRLLRTTDITSGEIDWLSVPFCTEAPTDLDKYLIRENDIVISRAGSVGVSHLVSHVEPAVFASYLIRFRPGPRVRPKYLAHFLKSPTYWKQIADNTSGIAIPNVNATKLQEVRLPLAPIDEQDRIVAEIEKQFSRLDEAVAGLKRVKANLKRYKAAILKAAVEGRLVPTEADLARREDRSYETGAQLLRRILETRRSQWQGKGKYKEPVAPDTTDLPELTEGWVWAGWDQVGFSQNGRPFPSKEYCNGGVKLLRPGNLHQSGTIVWSLENTRCMPERYAVENPDLIIGSDEIVMNLTAQSLKDEFLGRVCLTSSSEHCLLNQRLARLIPIAVTPSFALFVFKSSLFRRFVDGLNTGSLIQHMFTSQLASFSFPVPPLAEQRRIVAEVDRLLSIAREAEAEVETNLKRAQALRQAILSKAFTGDVQ